MKDFPSFADFYAAVHGDRKPLPWQERLADQVLSHGWPEEIGVPTGLGKTSTIDIAVWSLAASAKSGRDGVSPRRIWYVVNRRLLVDAASDHSERLAALLAAPDAAPATRQMTPARRREILSAVAARLLSLSAFGGSTGQPLFVSRLRGGTMLGGRPRDPSQPAIICSTVPMFGSRLLMRGFAVSNRMWPIDAALAGNDSLLLLDEAHLSEPLRRLVGLLKDCDANRTGVLRPPLWQPPDEECSTVLPATRAYPRLVALTATGRSTRRFELDDRDRAHPIVAQRLAASKPTAISTTTTTALVDDLARHALELLRQHNQANSLVVFANSPAVASATAKKIETSAKLPTGAEVIVLTGQLRELEAESARSRLLDPLTGVASGSVANRQHPLVVVATQTLEVGADVDFDLLVTESAGVRALTQRFGRLNRLGTKPFAHAVIVHPSDRGESGLYGEEPATVVARLASRCGKKSGVVDLGPARIAEAMGEPHDTPPRMPELLPAHLWEFAKTSTPPLDEAPPEVFFAGVEDDDLTVSFAWRSVLPDYGEPLDPPVADAEFVDVGLGEARRFIEAHAGSIRQLSPDGAAVEAASPTRVWPGQRLIVDTRAGGYSSTGWHADLLEEVFDVSPLYRHALALRADTVASLLGRPLDASEIETLAQLDLPDEEQPVQVIDDAVGNAVLAWLRVAGRPAQVPEERWPFGEAHFASVTRAANGLAILRFSMPRGAFDGRVRVDALDELSVAPTQYLDDHLRSVSEAARHIANAVGLDDRWTQAVANAGRFHDLGKADRRFQRWLDPVASRPLAKSDMSMTQWSRSQLRSGWPRGARHELLSVQLLDAALAAGHVLPDSDLVRHLVISHHGHGRPWVHVSSEGAPSPTTFDFDGICFTTPTDPSSPDWAQPARFRDACERVGYWGLCLLEAIVRQADHWISAVTEVQ